MAATRSLVPGIAASYAAGIVACDGAARIADVAVERGLFTAAPDATDLVTKSARYPARLAAGPGPDQLSLALQQRLTDAEVQLALAFRARHPAGDDLLVVDGPLRGRTHLDRTVGYVKTHHASYLPAEQAAVVAALRPGQRTPAFTMGTSWRRISWYLQLPGTAGAPMVGSGPAGVLGRPARRRGDRACRPDRPDTAPAGQRAAQGPARAAEPGSRSAASSASCAAGSGTSSSFTGACAPRRWQPGNPARWSG